MKRIRIRIRIRSAACIVLPLASGCLGGSSPQTGPADEASPRVEFVAHDQERTGIAFVNRLPAFHPTMNVVKFQYFYNGAGVAIGDVDGDGLPDVFFGGNVEPDRLYLNRGDLRFEDVTEAAGAYVDAGWTNGVSMVDIDADGDLDIYVARGGRVNAEHRANQLLVNDGKGHFTEQAAALGLADRGFSTHAAFLDYDRDGDLDVYVLNHPVRNQLDMPASEAVQLRDPNSGDRLYRNDGGRFTDVSEAAGIKGNPLGFGLSASVGDVDGDGWPDIYVGNDFLERDYLYVNQRDGTFRDELMAAMPHISQYSMGSDIADFDNDQLLDVLVADMAAPTHYRSKTMMKSMNVPRFRHMVESGFHYQYSFNSLQHNNGDGTFSDIAQLAGIARTDWSWAALALDLDNDGWRDIYVTNGRRRESSNVDVVNRKNLYRATGGLEGKRLEQFISEIPDGRVANLAFRNRGDLTFEDVSETGGLAFVGASNGAAYGDLDQDGDLDLVINNIDDPAVVYENKATEGTGVHHLRVAFEGSGNNPMGIGARVTVVSGDLAQVSEHFLNRGYMSSVEPGLHFGLGGHREVEEVRVRWPDGREQVLRDVPADQTLTVRYADAAEPAPAPPAPAPLLTDVTTESGLDFVHHENPFDDLAREILLPYETSKLGPAWAVGDVDADGLDDVYLGGAIGQEGALFVQDASGRFARTPGPWSAHTDREDVAAAFFDADGDGDVDLYVGSGGNEPEPGSAALRDRLYLNDGGRFSDATDRLPDLRASTGVVAAADVDADGDQDLFVGGRLLPGRYPLPPRSYLLRNDGDHFTDATEAIAPDLVEPGLVTAAAWSDLDGDADLDLVVVGEWMPVTVATNDGGALTAHPIPDSEGWWRSVAVLDGPGLLTGNVGRSIKFRASVDEPFRVYAKDFDDSGTLDIVLASMSDGHEVPVRGRECSSQQMPFIKDKFKTYHDFGSATLREVYGDDLDDALALRAEIFDSSLWTPDGDGWQRRSLPVLAQIGTVDGVVADDVDGDGISDLIVAGNLEKTEVETPRIDGGVGLVLLGSDSGELTPLMPRDSGFSARGDVKGLAKVALAGGTGVLVVRNDGPASLFRVTRAGR